MNPIASASPQHELPRWDLSSVFPSLQSVEFQTELESALTGITQLGELFEELNIRRQAQAGQEVSVADFEKILTGWNALVERLEVLYSYISCHVTTDASDEAARGLQSRLETQFVQLGQLETRLVAWVGSSNSEQLLAASQAAREHAHWVHKATTLGAHQMSEAEENLAAALAPMGLRGWASLHSNLTALLSVPVSLPGEDTRELPMSSVRALASSPDRAVRQAAFEAEIVAWKAAALPLCSALNGIKGYQRTLRERRGYADDVAPTLLANNTDSATLSAMQRACTASFPAFRRYMAAKARALGVEKLAWWDLIAPLGHEEKSWTWPEATQCIEENFGRYSPALADFARLSFTENWVDVGPRLGKVGGAYCTGMRPGESRVLMNFNGSFTDVSTLAHELGHAYHNLCLEPRTALQKEIPMTLAETASIFCETLVFEAAMESADPATQLALLDNALSRNLQVVVDIHSRFLFESAVFEKRAARDLAESEFCELMTAAQRATYGDDLEPLHPYMWAVKGHYYGPTFYNYPYTFGLLLGLGLYAVYQQEPETFRARYDAFLSKCGMADAGALAREFGFDLSTSAFWEGSLRVIEGQIDRFDSLIG